VITIKGNYENFTFSSINRFYHFIQRWQESILQSILTNMVDHAVSITTNEVKANVYQTVANTAYHFELEGESTMGKVQVTDIAVTSSADTEEVSPRAE